MESDEDTSNLTDCEDDSIFSGGEDDTDDSHQNPDNNFTILSRETIEERLEDEVNTVTSVLSVPRALARSLLVQHEWSVETVLDRCFADPPRYREPVRLSSSKIETSCGICFEESNPNPNLEFLSLACGHIFCVTCWETYISMSIQSGPGCLSLTCPEPGCKSTVGSDLIDELMSVGYRKKYHAYLARSYVERCRKRRWCPGPGCELAVEFEPVSWRSLEVTCGCSHKFCFGCGEESHRPLDCESVRRWAEKNTSESENATWILAYTKPCPECHRSIEKNQGCNHMTCRAPCRHQFCWVCLGPWDKHGTCNRYSRPARAELGRERAKVELERYLHYFERWDSNRRSRLMAVSDLDRARTEVVKEICKLQRVPETEVWFVVEAWERIIECRRVLRWSYAKAYYISVEEREKLKFFEFLQGQAESMLEKLHHCLEKEMADVKVEHDVSKLWDYRRKVLGLTRVTGNHFEEFVRAMEEE